MGGGDKEMKGKGSQLGVVDQQEQEPIRFSDPSRQQHARTKHRPSFRYLFFFFFSSLLFFSRDTKTRIKKTNPSDKCASFKILFNPKFVALTSRSTFNQQILIFLFRTSRVWDARVRGLQARK
jgi:hypothetical protein